MIDPGSTYPTAFGPKESLEDFRDLKQVLKNLKQVLSDNSKEIELLKKELVYQHEEKDKRAAELTLANLKLVYENNKKEKAASELVIANNELLYQNIEKEKRAAELILANAELVFQNIEKEKRATELLEANNELLSFTYISSHDLQEPLRKIRIFTERILHEDYERLSGTSKHHFSRISASALQMQRLIDGLLTLSRITTTDCEFENVDPDTFMNELDPALKAEMTKRGVILDISELGSLFINKVQASLMWNNLIDNSLKFSKPHAGLQIRLKSEIVPGSELNDRDLVFSKGKNYYHITFSDNGAGFDPQYNDLIFEVFKRLNRKSDYPGVGVGLAIVKKVVKNHAGSVTAQGEPDKGATFNIYLPVL